MPLFNKKQLTVQKGLTIEEAAEQPPEKFLRFQSAARGDPEGMSLLEAMSLQVTGLSGDCASTVQTTTSCPWCCLFVSSFPQTRSVYASIPASG